MLDMNSDAIKTVVTPTLIQDRDHHAMYKRKYEHRNNYKSATD